MEQLYLPLDRHLATLVHQEAWNLGILASRNPGTLEFWNLGTLESWNLESQESWALGMLESWNPVIL